VAVLPIVTYGHDVLKRQAGKVGKIDARVRRLAGDMLETLHQSKGVGLAAPQVGESLMLFVVNGESAFAETVHEKDDLVVINPVIREAEGSVTYEEGCLSVPQIRLNIERAETLTLEYTDLEGKKHSERAEGLFAEVVQHETDHLNGILIIDKISVLKRKLLYQKKLDEIKKKTLAEKQEATA
jgi:peptide deformylase